MRIRIKTNGKYFQKTFILLTLFFLVRVFRKNNLEGSDKQTSGNDKIKSLSLFDMYIRNAVYIGQKCIRNEALLSRYTDISFIELSLKVKGSKKKKSKKSKSSKSSNKEKDKKKDKDKEKGKDKGKDKKSKQGNTDSGTTSSTENSRDSSRNNENDTQTKTTNSMSQLSTAPLTKEEKKAQKKQDKLDAKDLKNQYLKSGMNKSDAKKMVKEQQKKLKKLRKTQPRATLPSMLAQETSTNIDNATQGGIADSMSQLSTVPLTKEEKKAQKKQDKLDAKDLKNQYLKAGMSKSEAKKKIKELQKQLKQVRKTQPRARIGNLSGSGIIGAVGAMGAMAGAVGSPEGVQNGIQPLDLNSVGIKLSDLEDRVEKLERKNKVRKEQILELNMKMNTLAKLTKKVMSRTSGSISSIDSDDD